MSKLIPDQSFIHMMESNVTGNRQGEKVRGWSLGVCAWSKSGWSEGVEFRGVCME